MKTYIYILKVSFFIILAVSPVLLPHDDYTQHTNIFQVVHLETTGDLVSEGDTDSKCKYLYSGKGFYSRVLIMQAVRTDSHYCFYTIKPQSKYPSWSKGTCS